MPKRIGIAGLAGAGRIVRRRGTGWTVALLASTALVAVPPALAPLGAHGVALAAGGASGSTVAGGASKATGTGDAGKTAAGLTGGSGGGAGEKGGDGGGRATTGGGAGGATAGANGEDGKGDNDIPASGGGGGGAHGYVGDAAPTTAVTGGKGGNGGQITTFKGASADSFTGGGGGAGGYGAVLTGAGPYVITHAITGGNGGNGAAANIDGAGGDGGNGLVLTQPDVSVTVSNGVVIKGGNPGKNGSLPPGTATGTIDPVAGIGIVGSDLTVILASRATVSGGYDPILKRNAEAIHFTSGTNVLELQGDGKTYATLTGLAVATGTSNTLKLSGLGGTFDLSKLQAGVPTRDSQYYSSPFLGFGNVVVESSGTWTAYGYQQLDGQATWTVGKGTFQFGDGTHVGRLKGSLTVEDGGVFAVLGGVPESDSAAYLVGDGLLTVETGGAMSVKGTTDAVVLKATTLTLKPKASLSFDLSNKPTFPLIVLGGAFTDQGTLSISALPKTDAAGSYKLVQYNTATADRDALSAISGPAGYTYTATLDPAQKMLTLQITQLDAFWNGSTTTGTTGPVAGGTGTWTMDSTVTNWTDADGKGRNPAAAGVGAIFDGTPGTVTVSGAKGAVTTTGLTFKVDGYTIAGDALILTKATGPQTITVAGAGTTARISAPLGSATDVALAGGGTLILGGANTYTGSTLVTEGLLQVGDGATSGSLAGDIVNNAKLVFDRSDATTYAKAISGTGSLEKKGAGTLVLTGDYKYTGATLVTAGTLNLSGRGPIESLGGGGILTGSMTVASGATLAVDGYARLASLWGSGNLAIGAAARFSVNADDSSSEFSGAISGKGRLNAVGKGTLTLSGTNTYSGGLIIERGSVVLKGGAANAADNVITMGFGATLDIVGGDAVAGGLVRDQSGPTVKLNGHTLTLGTSGRDVYRFDGGIEGSGRVVKVGTDTQLLGGSVIFDGPLTVSGGTLGIASVSSRTTVTVEAAGTLAVMRDSTRVSSLSGSGTVIGMATGQVPAIGSPTSAGLIVGGEDTDSTFSGTLADGPTTADALWLMKVGKGTLTLTGKSTFSGETDVSEGTLALAGGSLAGLVEVMAGGTLAGDLTGRKAGTIGGELKVDDGGTLSIASGARGLVTKGNVTLSGSAITALTLTAPGAVAGLSVGGNLTLGGRLNVTSGKSLASGTYRIFDYAGTLTNAGVTIGDAPADILFSLDTSTDKHVDLRVTLGQYWNGTTTGAGVAGGSGMWSANGTNWSDSTGSVAAAWSAGSLAVFAGTAGTVTVDAAAAPSVAAMSFTTDGYVLKGGAVELAGLAGSKSVRVMVQDDRVTGAGTATIASDLTGSGGLAKEGKGTLVLSGHGSYAGGTTVSAGTLSVSGSLAGPVAVASGGTLTGTGTVGAVTVQSGGILAGAQGQTLTTGHLTLASGAHLSVTLGASGAAGSPFVVNGDLVLNGTLDIASTTGKFGVGLYRLISYAGALSGGGLTTGTAGESTSGPDLAIKTDEAAKTVSVVVGEKQVTHWNSRQPGGLGTWRANTTSGSSTAIFAGVPGPITIDTSAGPVTVGGLQFASNGFLVQGGALTLTNAATAMRVGDGTRDGAASVATIASVLTGPGGVRKTDYGTLVLTGANTFTGGTAVETGTLKLGHAQALGTGALSLNEGTTLAFAGDLTVANAIRFPQTGDPILDTGANTVTISGEISGVGDLSKIGSGTLILSGTESYTGVTDVVSGTLVADGSLASSSGVTVESGATLGGAGTVPSVSALSGAIVAPGVVTPFSTLTVAGSVTFAAGSTLRVQVDAAGHTDAIAATGTATLSGGTVDVQAGTGTYTATQSYRILTAAGGRTGQFASLRTTTNLAFLKPLLSYDATGVSLGFTRATDSGTGTGGTGTGGTATGDTATGGSTGTGTGGSAGTSGSSGSSGTGGGTTGTGTGGSTGTGTTAGTTVVSFASVAASDNQREAAGAVQALGRGRLYDAVLSQSAAGARQAFDAVSGELHAGAMTAAVEESRAVRDAVLGRLQEASRGAAGAGLALWGTGFGSFGRQGGDGNAALLKRSLGGFVIGADGRVDAPGLSAWRLGVVGGYTDDTLSLTQRSSRGALKTVFGGLYAGAMEGALDIKLGVLGGGSQITTQRTVLFPGFLDSTHGRADGRLVQGFGEVGYRIERPQGFVEPVIQGALIHVGQDGLRETGGAAALRVWSRRADVGTVTVGVRGEMGLSAELPLMVRGFVGWRHAMGDVSPRALVSLGRAASPFGVSGTPIDRDAMVAEIGLAYRSSATTTLGVSYSAQAGSRASDQSVKGHFEVRF